jgi:CARDB
VLGVNYVDTNRADINVRYGPVGEPDQFYEPVGQPDPSIRPWPASIDRPWQSPDIEVRNQRNQTYPPWQNMPWEGHENTIVARVTNRGTLDAPGTVVNFYVQPFDLAGYAVGAPSFIGSNRRDVPAGETVEFTTMWIPPDQGHRCISVDIEQYSTLGASPVQELTDRNNFAQSNYVMYISRFASPFTRETISVGVNNPLDYRTTVFILPRQTHPHYRTYLEHTYLTLDPGERREVKIMFEYTQPADKNAGREFFRIPNHISVAAFVVPRNPYDLTKPIDEGEMTDVTSQPLGGVDIDVVAARATRFASFEIFGARGELRVKGKLVAVDDGSPVPDGKILLMDSPTPRWWPRPSVPNYKPIQTSLKLKMPRRPKGMRYREVQVRGGAFEAAVPSGRALRAYYGGAPGYSDCYSGTVLVPV